MTAERRTYTPEQIAWVEAAKTEDERSRRQDQLKASYKEPKALTKEETLVLNELAYVGEEYALYFIGIQNSTNLTRKEVRNACRSLAAKGLAVFRRGLFDEERGLVAGAGYGITVEGAKLAKSFDNIDAISATVVDSAL